MKLLKRQKHTILEWKVTGRRKKRTRYSQQRDLEKHNKKQNKPMVQRPSSKLISKRRPAPRLTPKQHCYSRCVEDVLWESELTQFWYIGFQIGLVLPESPPSRFQQFRVFSTEVSCLGYGVSGGRGSLHKGNCPTTDVLVPSPEKKGRIPQWTKRSRNQEADRFSSINVWLLGQSQSGG